MLLVSWSAPRRRHGVGVPSGSSCSCSMCSVVMSSPSSSAATPRRSTMTRGARRASSSVSVEQTTTAAPRAAASSTRRWMSALEPTSTPWVGSSSTSTRGVQRSQRAMTTFCWLPPDSSVMIASAACRAHVELVDPAARSPALSAPRAQPAPRQNGAGRRSSCSRGRMLSAEQRLGRRGRPARSRGRRRSPPAGRRAGRRPVDGDVAGARQAARSAGRRPPRARTR